ncbi:SpoIID/LytB domain-containing protein [Candidatus Poribacteria bacterium]|nr:SpoIID/LytB domain-containing protein [Candidatus Poribacteria bacterium]
MKIKYLFIIFFTIIFFVNLNYCIEKNNLIKINNDDNISVIRILIYTGNKITIDSESDIKIKSTNFEKIFHKHMDISFDNNTLKINNEIILPPVLITVVNPQALLCFNKKNYRGNFILEPEQNKLQLINRTNIEEYLYGVLRSEIPSNWHEEAIKCQIIAARTYALFKKKQNKNKKYHLEATTNSQVYSGFENESFSTNKLVDLTKGIIMTYNHEPIEAIYHSSCGGFTEDAQDIWGTYIPYLQGVYSDYCRNSPKYKWEKIIGYKEITHVLYKNDQIYSRINNVQIGKTTKSRRVITIICIDENKSKHEISTKNFRLWFGANEMPSTLFTIKNKTDEVIFEGRGFGHGVGLCQMCMKKMAEDGKNFHDILSYFYRNINIGKIYD